jgi:Ca2+-binding RTX toxin-like protein
VTGTTTNLTTGLVTVNGSPAPLPLSVTVQGFENVIGSNFADTIIGNNTSNFLKGGIGNDVLDGGGSDDQIFGDVEGPVFSFNNNLYTLSTAGSWTNAQAQAQALGGNLVAINSAAENQFLLNSFAGSGGSFWIGFTDVASEGTFTWVNGDPVTYTNWAPGEPNNDDGGEDYGEFIAREGGVWNDLPESPFPQSGIIEVNGGSILNNNDTILGSTGNDLINGGFGSDTVDYSSLGGPVTLGAFGVLNKGALGTDSLVSIETILGSAGSGDTVDHSGAVSGGGFTVTGTTTNLTTGLVTVNGSPAPLPLSVTVQGFENVIGSNFADSITGNSANNSLSGGAGNDSYGFDADLALGTDTLNEAGGGIDTLDFTATTTRSIAVNLGLATSQVVGSNLSLTLGSATTFENVIGGGLANRLTGNTLANSLIGGGGNDTLNGGGGNDTLTGGAGNDSYEIDADSALGTDTLNEAGGGIDTLNFSFTTTRSIAVNLGQSTSQVVNANLSLTLGSTTTFENVIGGGLADTLTGNTLANSLTGGGGNDTLIGGSGNDSYGFDADLALGTDTLNEAGGGIDTLNFTDTTTRSIAVNLGLATSQVLNANLSLTLGSTTTFESVIGGGLADTLTGNTLANSLTGGGGNDTLDGGANNDTLIGGAGADRFRFATAPNATTNRDVISDFSIAQGDIIELENAVFTALTTTGTLAASAFFIGAAATTATQRILYNNASGILLYDSDGIGAIGSIAFATITTGLALTNTSFTVT